MNPTYRNLDDSTLELITVEPDGDVIFRASSPFHAARVDTLLTLDDQADLAARLLANLTEQRPTPTIGDAAALAARLHDGQTYGDQPYIVHPADVAARVAVNGDHAVMAAWLHDVVEDTPCTLTALRALGYPDQVVSAVDAVTRRYDTAGKPLETYKQFIHRAAQHPLGRIIKLADNASNTAKLDSVPDAERREGLRRRYANARHILYTAGAREPEATELHTGGTR